MTTKQQQAAKRRQVKKPTNGTKPGVITAEDAMTILRQEQQERVHQCQAEIADPMKQVQEILARHNCSHLIYGQMGSGTWVPVTDLGVFQNVRLVVSPNAQKN